MADSTTRDPRQNLDRARGTMTEILAGFTTGQKTMTVLAVIALVMAGMFFVRWVSQPSLAPLFSDISATDAAAITEELESRGVAYELADGGRTILVPRDQRSSMRLAMSGEGLLPADGVGFSILDDNGVTTPEAMWNAEYQRAIEGELATTISSMDIIDSARVHLVIPEEDLFIQDVEMASASVFLSLAPGMTPTPVQIQSVVNLVAGSVQGLVPSQITVTDTAGNMLAAPGDQGQMTAMGDARQYQTSSFESRLASNVEGMLEQVMGPDAAVVTVTADLNFDTVAQTSETYGNDGPDGGIPLESTVTNETFTGIGAEQTGVLGPDGNLIGGGEGEQTTYTLEDGTTRFAVDRSVQEILQAPGSVNRLSVAVLLDSTDGAPDAQAVQALVEAAVGFNGDRGDIVQVSAMAFDTRATEAAAAAAEEAAAAAKSQQMFDMIRTIGSVLIVMLVLFLAWRSARKSMPVREARSVPLDVGEFRLDDEDDVEDYTLEDADLPQLPAGPSITDEVTEMIDSQHDEMAGLLRGWMVEK